MGDEVCRSQGADLDRFHEALHVRMVPFTRSPRLFLARFEFGIEAPLTGAFRSDQFDLFPKPLGKLLNAHRSLSAFEATLTRGRWKREWGRPPREFRPPGAFLAAATNATLAPAVQGAWSALAAALSGVLCTSLEGLDVARGSPAWARPLQVPWAEAGQRLQMATLPYEPLCTENLTPWLKLLPCGRHRGLPALLGPGALAEAPLLSLALLVAARRSPARAELRASLDVVLPLGTERGSLASWFHGRAYTRCPAAESARVLLLPSRLPPPSALKEAGAEVLVAEGGEGGEGAVLAFPAERFAELSDPTALFLSVETPQGPGLPTWPLEADPHAGGASVMRDILSYEGRSERTHGRYLLRFTNTGKSRRIRFMDQLPFFIRPLWHTFRASFQAREGAVEQLSGQAAMRRLEAHFVASDGQRLPTEVFLTVDVPAGGTVGLSMDVAKAFIQLREFSYACEKGFDVGSAAWLEAELPAEGGTEPEGLLAPAPTAPGSDPPAGGWRLRLTRGLIVLLPMPDFSMPFNVIALSSTAVTFFFGSVFRLTAAGRVPHWLLKREESNRRNWAFWLQRLLLAAILGGTYALHATEASQLQELRVALPAAASPLVDLLESARDYLEKLGR